MMLIFYFSLLDVGSAALLRHGEQRGSKPVGSTIAYSFAEFARDYDRKYEIGSNEYTRRAALFDASLLQIHQINAENVRDGRQWLAGVHPFMDWSESERTTLKGYKPHRGLHSRRKFSALQISATDTLNQSWSSDGTGSAWEGIALRDQGMCGSCWAISAVEAVEARLPGNVKASAQALVDCVPNPQHCGGKGGCDGATGELAYEYMRDYGLPLDSGYEYTGKDGSCQADAASPNTQRIRLSGWTNLPSNKAQPLMDALYNSGPVVVAVDADQWLNYGKGIFDSCGKDAIIDHAVLAKGYGGEGDAMWWLIQNSWGAGWGEQGHIRLKRRDTAAEEAYCGQDNKPSEGLGCHGGPSEVTVCGSCGLLYDPLYPEGVTLEGGEMQKMQTQIGASKDDALESVRPSTVEALPTQDAKPLEVASTVGALPTQDAKPPEPAGKADDNAVDRMRKLLFQSQ
jgi:cathepsin L